MQEYFNPKQYAQDLYDEWRLYHDIVDLKSRLTSLPASIKDEVCWQLRLIHTSQGIYDSVDEFLELIRSVEGK